MSMRIERLFPADFGLVAALAFSASVCFSQTDQSSAFPGPMGSSTTNFHFAEPNELTIVVNILGSVQRPGRYEISRSIDLLNLISLAGGSSERLSLGNIRVLRTFKSGGRIDRREIKVNLDRLAQVNDADLMLSHGDLVIVEASSGITMQEVLSYLTTAAVLTTAVITIINQSK